MMTKCEIPINFEDETFKRIKESEVIVFFLTSNYLKSKLVEQEFTIARKEQKIIIPIYVVDEEEKREKYDNIVDFDDFNVITLHEPICSSRNKTALRRFQIFLLSALRIETSTEDMLDEKIRTIKLKVDVKEVKWISDDEIVMRSSKDELFIININKSKITGTGIKHVRSFFWIAHLKQIYVLSSMHMNGEFYKLNNNRFEYLHEEDNFELMRYCTIIDYNHIDRKTYVMTYNNIFAIDENFLEKKLCIETSTDCNFRVLNGYIYKWYKTIIYVFNLFYEYVTSVKAASQVISILADPKNLSFLFVKHHYEIKIYETNLFSIIGVIKSPFDLLMVLNERLIFQHENELVINKICFNKKISFIDEPLICKINPCKPHLYSNPYFLPCGN